MDRRARAWWPAVVVAALVVVAGGVSVIAAAPPAQAAQSPTSCAGSIGLVNGGFESPVLPAASFQFIHQSGVPGWRTTASDEVIEIWNSGWRGVSSAVGDQFAELNATQPSTLYQDQPTIPGTVMRWSLRHRGREGVDTMAVNIGPPGGTLVQQQVITDDITTWGTYSGLYTVPAGQTTTRFAFAAVSTYQGNLSIGNFLDDVSFGTSACVVGTQSAASPTGAAFARSGDVVTLVVKATSGGGNPATTTSMTTTVPAGVTYVPGSLRVGTGTATTAASDAGTDDQAEYDPGSRTLTARLGTGATSSTGGSITKGDVGVLTYQVVVDPASSPGTFTTDSTVTYVDPLTGSTRVSTTNPVSLALNPIADLAATLVRSSSGPVVAGTQVTYTATLTNNGRPSAAAGEDTAFLVTLTSQLPAALTGVTGTTPVGSCSVSGRTLTCAAGDLAKGAQRVITVTGTVAPDTAAGSALTVGITAGTGSQDADPANNTASVTDPVTVSADIGVTLTVTPSPPVAGADMSYAAVVTNRGPSTARTISFSDPVPTGTANPRASVPGGTCSVAVVNGVNTVTCALPDLAPATSVSVTVVVLPGSALTGSITNTVTVSTATPDPATANNTARLVSKLTSVADLTATLTVPAVNTPLGGSTAYTVTVRNQGPSTAVSTRVTFAGPTGLAFVPTIDQYCTAAGCTIPSLAPGASVQLTGTVTVASSVPPGRTTVTATATSTTTDPKPADNTGSAVVLAGAPAVQLSILGAITDTRRTRGAEAGDRVVWTYVVTNTGDVDVTGLTVVLPGTTTPILTTCQLGTLPRQATTACRAVLPQTVGVLDVQGLAVRTSAEVTVSWVGQTAVRAPLATGAVTTALPSTLVLPTSLDAPASVDEPDQTSLAAVAVLGVGAMVGVGLRPPHRWRRARAGERPTPADEDDVVPSPRTSLVPAGHDSALSVVPDAVDPVDAGLDGLVDTSLPDTVLLDTSLLDTVLLDTVMREGARRLLAAALQAEVAAHVDRFADERDGAGRRLVVRNGYHRTRQVMTAVGMVPVRAPRVRDRRIDPGTGQRVRFASTILPARCRRAAMVTDVLALLYLDGLTGPDIGPALGRVLGASAGLPGPVSTELTAIWRAEQRAFAARDLPADHHGFVRADVRLDSDHPADERCLPVPVGVRTGDSGEPLARSAGRRESSGSWAT